MLDKRLDIIYNNKSKVRGSLRSMTLEFGEAVKVIEGHIEILKQKCCFRWRNATRKNITQIITVRRELDKAVEEKMKVLQIYCSPPLSISS
jgi:hypothetical protein